MAKYRSDEQIVADMRRPAEDFEFQHEREARIMLASLLEEAANRLEELSNEVDGLYEDMSSGL